MKGDVILTMRNITKTFPGVVALSNVDFTLRSGEVHALMGENGAGKSTLIKVLTGVEPLDSGTITLEGKEILAKDPNHAVALGISTVYQEVNLCHNLTVAENIFIGRAPLKNGFVDWKQINKKAKEALLKLNIDIDVTKTLDSYSIAIQQMVAIARALDVSSKVLILDEPTSSLDQNEVAKLFEVIRKLRDEGMGIIFVTHFLDQVYEISDRITVLRNGQLVGEYEVESLPKVQLVAKMIGKELDELKSFNKEEISQRDFSEENVIVKAKNVETEKLQPYSLDINRGEVVGLAGLLGSGRSEIARSIFGIDRILSGELYINKKKTNLKNPINAMMRGIGFLPEDRKTEGIIGDLSVRENIIIALQAKRGLFKYLRKKKQLQIADEYIKKLQIKCSSPDQPVKNLSGGNQQKCILARWLITNPDLLILDEPTRGIDIGTKTEIQKLVVQLAEQGVGVLFISSELDEMIRCCTRIAVMRDGAKIGELVGDGINEHTIMQTIAGGENS